MIDWKATIAKADGNEVFAKELVDDFIEELRVEKPNMFNAFEQRDFESLRRQAHKLKGGLSFCMVPSLNFVVRSLEQACIEADENKVKDYYAEAVKLIDDLTREANAPEKC